MDGHTVKSYDDELATLDAKVARMGELADAILRQSFHALERRDAAMAEAVVKSDRVIDGLQRDIEEQVITLIARRQPMAIDLRHVVSALRIAGDLERIGDLAKNLAKRALAISGEPHPATLMTSLQSLGDMALGQLRLALDAYAKSNSEAAVAVWNSDRRVDAAYNSLFRELLTYMMEDPRNIGISTHLLFGAKNIERVGDHATNIAETVYYLVTGDNLLEERDRDDQTASYLPQP